MGYRHFTAAEVREARKLHREGVHIKEICKALNRSEGAVRRALGNPGRRRAKVIAAVTDDLAATITAVRNVLTHATWDEATKVKVALALLAQA